MEAITMANGSNNMNQLLDELILEGVFSTNSAHLINFEKENSWWGSAPISKINC
ncbi:hypothetical protein CCP3SC5AM1_50003 [Gammaproteobacteria bacterium]